MNHLEETNVYVLQLHAGHQRLQVALQHIEQDWQQFEAHMIEQLQQLRQTLDAHFHDEDAVCFDEAVCRCPRLGPEADRLEREHPQLLAELDDIIARFRRAKHLRQDFTGFADRVWTHEAAENSILQEAFGMGTED